MEENNSWLQAKVASQRVMLDALHSRVVRQRFQLRTLEKLGRSLTTEEFLKAKADEEPNEQAAKRIGEP